MRTIRKEDKESFVDRLVSLVEADVTKSIGNARYSDEEFSGLVGFVLEKVAEALFESVTKKI